MPLLFLPPVPGPAVVVLLKDGCPCARECHVALNALANACRGKIRFVGLLDADAKRAKALAKEAGLRFPVLPDPKRATIRSLAAHEALDLRLVDAKGRTVSAWDALDRANVASLVGAVARGFGADIGLSLEPFTVFPKVGCPFDLKADAPRRPMRPLVFCGSWLKNGKSNVVPFAFT